MIRIMTSNIWGDYFNNPVESRMENVITYIKTYFPDVVGLQEITPGWYNSGLFKHLSTFYETVEFELNNYTPLLFKKQRYDLIECGWELLSDTPDPSKSITWAVLSDKQTGVKFGVCNTHFWWMERNENDDRLREQNAEQLYKKIKYIKDKYDVTVFSFGDLNCNCENIAIKLLNEQNVELAYDIAKKKSSTSSYHGNPILGTDGKYHGSRTNDDHNKSIDHILVYGKDFAINEYVVIEDQFVLDATDHSPVYIDIAE